MAAQLRAVKVAWRAGGRMGEGFEIYSEDETGKWARKVFLIIICDVQPSPCFYLTIQHCYQETRTPLGCVRTKNETRKQSSFKYKIEDS